MTTLLARLFIKDYDNTSNPDVRCSYGMLSSIVGIALNILLFIGKYFAGIISGSIAITADAFNNLSDAGSSFITLVGFKFAGMKPDADHPFGHGRIEYIAGFTVSIAIILMGVELLQSSFNKIISPSDVTYSTLTLAILVISICVKIYMWLYNRSIGKKIESAAMGATAADSLSDSVATTVVLISAIVANMTGFHIDGWCGILVALFILYAGYGAAKDTLSPLLGQAPSPELVDKIVSITMAHDEILGIHDLVIHDYGPGRLMVSLHGEVSGNSDIFELHDVIDRIEAELDEKIGCESVIHMDPIEADNETVTNMRKQVNELIVTFDKDLSIHDFRMVQGPTHTNLIFDVVVPPRYRMTDEELKKTIESMITEKWDNHFAVIKVDKSYI